MAAPRNTADNRAGVNPRLVDNLPYQVFPTYNVFAAGEARYLDVTVLEYVIFHSLADRGKRNEDGVFPVSPQREVDGRRLHLPKQFVQGMGAHR
jgi:hypothetical protein